MTPSELWYKENQHFLLLMVLQIAVVVLLVFAVLPVGDLAISVWRDVVNPEVVPSEADLNGQIVFWEQANDRLAAQLDSATSRSRESESQEKQLAAIQTAVAKCRLSLFSCDVRPLAGSNEQASTAFDLQMRGSFHGLGKLITDLETSPLAVVVDRMSLEGTESGSGSINASVTLISRRGERL